MDSLLTGDPSGDSQTPRRRGFYGTEETFRTKICTRWQQGHCRFGQKCAFAHGEHELRIRTPRKQGLQRLSDGWGSGQSDETYANPFSLGDGLELAPLGFGSTDPASVAAARNLLAHNSRQRVAAIAGSNAATRGLSRELSGSSWPGTGLIDGTYRNFAADLQPLTAVDGWGGLPMVDTAAVQGPNGWMRYTDPKTGNYYYHHVYKAVTTWDEPEEWRGVFGSSSAQPSSGIPAA